MVREAQNTVPDGSVGVDGVDVLSICNLDLPCFSAAPEL
jgi:hypothetical protein